MVDIRSLPPETKLGLMLLAQRMALRATQHDLTRGQGQGVQNQILQALANRLQMSGQPQPQQPPQGNPVVPPGTLPNQPVFASAPSGQQPASNLPPTQPNPFVLPGTLPQQPVPVARNPVAPPANVQSILPLLQALLQGGRA